MDSNTLDKNMRIYHFYCIEQLSLKKTASAVPCTTEYAKKVLTSRFNIDLRSNKESMRLRSTPEYKEKLRKTQLGESNHQSVLGEKEVIEIRTKYERLLDTYTKTQAQKLLGEEYGVKRPTISDVVLRNTWKHI